MNGLDHLSLQQQQLREAFDELEVTVEPEARIRLLAHIAQRLKAHMAVEEEIVYPSLATPNTAPLVERVDAAHEAHRAIDLLLDETMGAELTSAKVKVLRDFIDRHFADVEHHLFPVARQVDGDSHGKLSAAVEEFLEEFGDGMDDPLPAADVGE